MGIFIESVEKREIAKGDYLLRTLRRELTQEIPLPREPLTDTSSISSIEK